MPAERIAMRKIREVLRLRWELGLNERSTARACKVARSTVQQYLIRATRSGLSSWSEVEALEERALESLLFPPPPSREVERQLPNWSEVHLELQRPGVTRSLVWEEYKEKYPEGLAYSRFCELYRAFRAKLDLSLRQVHKGRRADVCGLLRSACHGSRPGHG